MPAYDPEADAGVSGKQRCGDRSDDIRNLSILYEIEVDMNDSKKMAKIAYDALDEKKAEDIRVIDISGITVVADYFIIANGNSDNQVRALVDNVQEQLYKSGL